MVSLVKVLVLLLILCPLTLASAGVRGPGVEERRLDFEPGKVVRMSFYLYGSDMLNLLVDGSLAGYAEVEDPNPSGGPRTVTLVLTLPDELPPGEHKVFVGAREESPGGMIGGRAGALMGITVKVLSDEPAIKAKLDVAHAGVDDATTQGTLTVESWSKQDITVYGDIILYDEDEHARVTTEQKTIPSNAKETFKFSLPIEGLVKGNYRVSALVHYADNTTSLDRNFRIGAMGVQLKDHPTELTADTINRFDMLVVSDWNQYMGDVAASVYVNNELAGSSPTDVLEPFNENTFTAFIDASEMTPGQVDGFVRVNFLGESQDFPITLTVVEQPTPASTAAVETQQASSFGILPVLYIGLILLVLINVFLLLRRRK